jgi:hypothetical protein
MTTTVALTRKEILAQHQAIRAQLSALRREAERTVRGQPGEAADLPGMLDRLVHALREHIAFENEHLSPLLHGCNPFGRRYATLLLEEHARQHHELVAIARQAADPDDHVSLALAIAGFAGDMLHDMEDEELQFLTPHLLTDGEHAERGAGR